MTSQQPALSGGPPTAAPGDSAAAEDGESVPLAADLAGPPTAGPGDSAAAGDGESVPPAAADSPGPDSDSDSDSGQSGVSNISGLNWKPNAGPICWVQEQIGSGLDPREVLHTLRPSLGPIPANIDDIKLWKLVVEMLMEPPRREKLRHVNTLSDVVRLIRGASNVIVLTGAGVSVSCGIPDFRSRDGIYARLAVDFPDLPDPQAMFDIHYFRRDPRPFFKFAREIYPGQFKPSPCHRFIRMLEREGKLLRNYTQNIDTLEQQAGIENVIQCHGSFATASCQRCRRRVPAEEIREAIFQQTIPVCPLCSAADQGTGDGDGAGTSTGGTNTTTTTGGGGGGGVSSAGAGAGPAAAAAADSTEGAAVTALGASLQHGPAGGGHHHQPSAGGRRPDTVVPPTAGTEPHHRASGEDTADRRTAASSSPDGEDRPGAVDEDTGDSGFVPSNRETEDETSQRRPPADKDGRPQPIMKPDIVFFGEGLSDEFHHSMELDRDKCDLLIIIGSSLKVRPVALIPSSVTSNVAQILINREPLPHLNCDVQLLGDCDVIVHHLCHLLGEPFSGLLQPPSEPRQLTEITELPPRAAPDSPLPPPPADPAHENDTDALRHCWQPKVQESIAARLPEGTYLYQPPCRYIFSGAEVLVDPDDSDSDRQSLVSDQDSDDEGPSGAREEPPAGDGAGRPPEPPVTPPAAEDCPATPPPSSPPPSAAAAAAGSPAADGGRLKRPLDGASAGPGPKRSDAPGQSGGGGGGVS